MWRIMRAELLRAFSITPRALVVYIVIYAAAGFINNTIGREMRIAEFAHWWQVLTCYVVYLIPVSLLVRNKSISQQYLHGLFFLALLELGGYALQTSIAHEGNIFDRVFQVRNFSLVMALLFGSIPPVGNYLVKQVCQMLGVGIDSHSTGDRQPSLRTRSLGRS